MNNGQRSRGPRVRTGASVAVERSVADRPLSRGEVVDRPSREQAWPATAAVPSRAYGGAAAIALAGVVVVAITVRVVLGQRIVTPWIMVDEYLYSELAKSFAEHGRFLVRGGSFGDFGKVYPALISPAWLWHSMPLTYGIAKGINAAAMSLAAVPVYLWARRLLTPVLALVTAALVLLLPAFVYTGALMTENAAFPTFSLALFAIAFALERPTLWAQAFALLAIGLAAAVRVQAAILVLVLVLAVALKAILDLRARPGAFRAALRPYLPTLAAVAALALAYVALKLLQGAALSSGLGSYSVVVGAHYPWHGMWRWILYHFAELALAVGVVPFAALGVLTGLAYARGLPSAAERAFIAVAVPAVVLVVVQVAVFASRFAFRIEERNMIYVMPILLLAFMLWIGRGLPRPAVIAPVAALGSAALLLAIPLSKFLTAGLITDTFGLIPWLKLQSDLSGNTHEVRWIMLFAAFDVALAFLFLPRRAAAIFLPLFVAGYLAYVSSSVLDEVVAYSKIVRQAIPGNASWIDQRVGWRADVAFVNGRSGPAESGVPLWEVEFWNRSLKHVYNFGTPNPIGIPENLVIIGKNGRLTSGTSVAVGTPYAIAGRTRTLAGAPLVTRRDKTLYATPRPPVLRSWLRGVSRDGWMASAATYDRYSTPGGRPGTLRVEVSRAVWGGPDRPGHVVVTIGPLATSRAGSARTAVTARRMWTVHSLEERAFMLPTPPPPFEVQISIRPTFSPADYGSTDTRQLGAQVGFAFLPAR